MTTFVYNKKENKIALNGRESSGALISSEKAEKWTVTDTGNTYFTIGGVSDCKMLIEAVERGDASLGDHVVCNGTLIKPGNPVVMYGYYEEAIFTEVLDNEFSAYGSGRDFAYAAFDHGKSAKDCVKYAMTRDCYTGGKITVFDVSKMKFCRQRWRVTIS